MDGAKTPERRRVQRVPATTIGPLLLAWDSEAAVAEAVDISVQGIGLRTSCQLDRSKTIRVNGLRGPLNLTLRVRHSTPQPTGQWLNGCEFDHLLTVDDLLLLG